MYINLNGELITCSAVRYGDKLSLMLTGAEDVVAVYGAFQPDKMPEITIFDESGKTEAIYANHRVLEVALQAASVNVRLQVDPLEVGEAVKIREAIADQAAGAEISDGAIAELAEFYAGLEERVAALEGGEQNG